MLVAPDVRERLLPGLPVMVDESTGHPVDFDLSNAARTLADCSLVVVDEDRILIPNEQASKLEFGIETSNDSEQNNSMNGLLISAAFDSFEVDISKTQRFHVQAWASADNISAAARAIGRTPGVDIFNFVDTKEMADDCGRFEAPQYLKHFANGEVPLSLLREYYLTHDRTLDDHVLGWLFMPTELKDIIQTAAQVALTFDREIQADLTEWIDQVSTHTTRLAKYRLRGNTKPPEVDMNYASLFRAIYEIAGEALTDDDFIRLERATDRLALNTKIDIERSRPTDPNENPIRRWGRLALMQARVHLDKFAHSQKR